MVTEKKLNGPKKGNEGLTLVETMIAAVVLTVGLLGLMSAITSSMFADTVTRENNAALDLGRKIMEQYSSMSFWSLERMADLTIPLNLDLGDVQVFDNADGTGDIEVQLDAAGRWRMQGLEPVDPTIRNGRVVGTIRIARAGIVGQPAFTDVVEITVTVSWIGARGDTSQTFRCRVADWSD